MVKYIHRRNIALKNKLTKIDKKKILGVGIDPSKHFHRILIFDFTGRLLTKPFSVNVLKTGYERLIRQIRAIEKRKSIKHTYIAIESTGTCTNVFFNYLKKEFKNVYVIHTSAVANNRNQRSLQGLKTDDIDAGSIGDLLMRAEFNDCANFNPKYYNLREMICWRESKIKVVAMLKNQINARFNKIFYGFNTQFEDEKCVIKYPKNTKLYDILINFLESPRKLIGLNIKGMRTILSLGTGVSSKKINEVIERLNKLLLLDTRIEENQILLLKHDITILNIIEKSIEAIEQKILAIGIKTPAKYIANQIKGIDLLTSSIYVGLIGDVKRYKSASHIYSMSGLTPKIKESGQKKIVRKGITKKGNRLLRAVLFRMALQAIMDDPKFHAYYAKLKKRKLEKHWRHRIIIMANKLNRIFFALMRDKSKFDSRKLAAGNSV